MNKQIKEVTDPLGRYLDPESIEKAPSGFTAKVMENIHIEAIHTYQSRSILSPKLVPVVSVVVTVLLIIAAVVIPGKQSDPFAMILTNHIPDFRFSLPEIDLTSILNINFPEALIWAFSGIIILTFFDRFLSGLFQRGK